MGSVTRSISLRPFSCRDKKTGAGIGLHIQGSCSGCSGGWWMYTGGLRTAGGPGIKGCSLLRSFSYASRVDPRGHITWGELSGKTG